MLLLEKCAFEWEDTILEFKYSIKLSNDKKIIKRIDIGKKTTKQLFLDISRMLNNSTSTMDRPHLRSFLFGYVWNDDVIESYFNINLTEPSKDFTSITILQNNLYMRHFDTTNNAGVGADFYCKTMDCFTAYME